MTVSAVTIMNSTATAPPMSVVSSEVVLVSVLEQSVAVLSAWQISGAMWQQEAVHMHEIMKFN